MRTLDGEGPEEVDCFFGPRSRFFGTTRFSKTAGEVNHGTRKIRHVASSLEKIESAQVAADEVALGNALRHHPEPVVSLDLSVMLVQVPGVVAPGCRRFHEHGSFTE